MTSLQNRKRKIDLNKLLKEEAENISKIVGDEINRLLNEAVERCNNILNIYDLKLILGYNIITKEDLKETEKMLKESKKIIKKAEKLNKKKKKTTKRKRATKSKKKE